MAVFVALLLAVTMIPAAGVQTASADEQFAVDGLMYKTVDGGAVLVGFEDGGSLGDNITVPEKVSGEAGELTVVGVDVAEGQSAPNVKALTLPQTVENINTKSLAAALPGLASVNVDGTAGAYSSANGLLFKQADEAASSGGSTVRVANRELLWTPPATVIARIPGTCKRVAAGAFTDAKALETIMAFSTVESIARPEKDADGNVTKEGAFADEQVSRVNIVIPISATVRPEGEGRISTDVFLSEQVGLDVKQTPWCDYGFDIKRFTVGIPCGSTSVTVAVPESGKVETPVITVGDYVGYPQWNPKPGEVDWPADGLVFEYKADMTVSVRWDGNKEAIPSHLELPAYVVENGVKTAVTEVAPNAFEGASQLESVVVPEGVTTIGESAFAGCSGLKSVSLPSTLKTIDYAAFKGAGLESVEIPSAVRWIGGEAFDEGLLDVDESFVTRPDVGVVSRDESTAVQEYSSSIVGTYPAYTVRPDSSNHWYNQFIHLENFDEFSIYHCSESTNQYRMDQFDAGIRIGALPMNYDEHPVTEPTKLALWMDQDNYRCVSVCQQDGVLYASSLFGRHLDNTNNSPLGYYHHVATIGATPIAGERSAVSWRLGSPYGEAVTENRWPEPVCWRDLPSVYPVALHGRSNFVFSNLGDSPVTLTFADGTTRTVGSRTSANVLLKSGERVILENLAHYVGSWTVSDGGSGRLTEESGKTVFIAGASPATLSASFTAEDFAISFNTNGGSWGGVGKPDKVSYAYGENYTLPRNVERQGFWFAGWYPTSTEADWKQTQDNKGLVKSITADAYGDVDFHAVWIPMTYTIDYDVAKGLVDDLPDDVFIHPEAVKQLRTKTSYAWPDGSRYDGSKVVSGTAPASYSFTDTGYVDLTGLSASVLVDFDLAECSLAGYDYVGWCSDDKLQPGKTDPAGGATFTHLYKITDKDGSLSTEDSNMEAIFGANWQADNEKPNPAPKRTLYCVWAPTDMTTITLEANQPAFENNAGADVVTTDGKGSAAPGTSSIRFWNDRGFIGQAPAEGADATYAEAAGPGTPSRTGSTEADKPIDTAMGLKAPVRYGFQFVGWGKADASGDPGKATVYISYDENAGRTQNREGFSLTKAGAALVEHDGDTCTLASDAPTTWQSIWRIRTVEVSLRIPMPAVADADVTGDSTKAGHDVKDSVSTNYFYDDYKWREGTSGETEGGATSSWYIAKRVWNYGDVLEMPAFKPRDGYYSYDGWFDAVKPSAAVSTDAALEADGSITKIATFEGLRPHKANMRVTGSSEVNAGLNIPDAFFETGVDAGTMSKKELWLWVSPIRINVSSPVGIYLCQTNSYGTAVEPYVVGNDTRTQLESRAEFQVAMNSHDLQVVGIEAEDVIDVAQVPEKDEAGNETGNTVDVVTTVADKAGQAKPDGSKYTAADGICRQIIEPKYKRSGNNFVNDNYYYGSAAEPNEGSRMFWVSPVPTATADQEGVIYGGSQTAAGAGGTAAESTLTAAEEKALSPDVNKRRYFGYGYTLDAEDMTGVSSDTTLGGEKVELTEGASLQDNVITDKLNSTVGGEDTYKLGDFVLRARDDEGGVLTRGLGEDELGLAYLGKGEGGADTYRFYYGLDMRRCSFDLTGLQNIIENSESLGYDSAFDQPLLKVKFTFAAARNEGISYYSVAARNGETVDMDADAGIPAETSITVAG